MKGHENMIKVFIGYDENETVAFHVLAHSIMRHSSQPVEIVPVVKSQMSSFYKRERAVIESTDFSFTRFLTPYLCGFEGWAIFVDCDMLVTSDIAELWALRDDKYALMCVKHDYQPVGETKFLNQPQTKYENSYTHSQTQNDRKRLHPRKLPQRSLVQQHPEVTRKRSKPVLNQFGKLSSSKSRSSVENFKESHRFD